MNRTALGSFMAAMLLSAGAAPAQTAPATAAAPLKVCLSEDNAPLSTMRQRQMVGFDAALAQAVGRELGREVRLVPFEPEVEKEAMLTHEVNALLSSGVCDLVTGFPLLKSDLGAPTRARFKAPDHPGAKPPRERPYIELGTLIHSQPYLGSALVVVQRADAPAARGLGDLKGRKVAAVAGTLEGTLIAMYGGGALNAGMVSMGQREDVWAALKSGRVDALLVPTTALDAHRQREPASTVQAGPPRPLGINLGFVALAAQAPLLDAVNRVVARAQAGGDLQRWASDAGLSWVPPTAPVVADTLKLDALLGD